MRRFAFILSMMLACSPAWSQQSPVQKNETKQSYIGPVQPDIWQMQESNVDVQLRGISVVSDMVAWASGAKGTVLRTTDGGKKWLKMDVVDTEDLDFRDIQAFDQNTAYVLSIGEGEKSRIYKTTDGGRIWQRQFTNYNPNAFYDCFAFWDSTHGIALSDSVDGKFPLIATSDGALWDPVLVKKMPDALPKEGAFAASGTCIATFGKNDVWFATGGPAARVFHSSDRGVNWTATETPIIHGEATQGVFSLFFWSAKDGVAVGGDYKEPFKGEANAAVTHDGGKTWKLAEHLPGGYRSGLARWRGRDKEALVAVGTGGSDGSSTEGQKWGPLHLNDKPWTNSDAYAFNAVDCAHGVCWAVGPQGRIGWIKGDPLQRGMIE